MSDELFAATPATGAPPLVDVNVTAFRRTTFLRDALRSVLAQTDARWHLRICENGPGGGDIERLAAEFLSDPRVSYHATGRELSQAENWTNAINLGDAPFVALLNDDDWWDPDYLRVRLGALEANLGCGFAFSEWKLVDEVGLEIVRSPVRFTEGVPSRASLAHHLLRHNIAVPPAIVIRRSALEAVGAFYDERWQFFDWELLARLAAQFTAYYLPLHDNSYRRHGSAVTFNRSEEPDRLIGMLAHIEELFERHMGLSMSPLARRDLRSQALLEAAADIHPSAGWSQSRGLYWRAVRIFPPSVAKRQALGMYAMTVVGARLFQRLQAARRQAAPRNVH